MKAHEILVVGVGSGGGNIVASLEKKNLHNVKLLVMDIDKKALEKITTRKIEIKVDTPLEFFDAKGKVSPIREIEAQTFEDIKENIKENRLVFIVSTLSGRTGTGITPMITNISRDFGATTICVVTSPFRFEGKHKTILATESINRLKKESDYLVAFPNDKIKGLDENSNNLKDDFNKLNEMLVGYINELIDIAIKEDELNSSLAKKIDEIEKSIETLEIKRTVI